MRNRGRTTGSMSHMSQRIRMAGGASYDKIKRNAFLYMDPREDYYDQFAQCSTCRMYVDGLCSLHGRDVPVDPGASCGLYVPGTQEESEKQHISKDVSPSESGLYHGQVRCENCAHFDPQQSECILFKMLNQELPEVFSLDVSVHAKGCCNAFVPRGGEL